jgi:hypothetical protein
MEEKEKPIDKKFKALTPACYGCTYMCATPVLYCIHPLSIRISYDGFTGRSYRFPSFDLCLMNRGMCNFYEPSPSRGAEYSLMVEERKEEAKQKEALDAVLDKAGKIPKEELKEELKVVVASMEKDDDEI